jgi:hypothetical protein
VIGAEIETLFREVSQAAEKKLINAVLQAAVDTDTRQELVDKIIAISDEVYAK